MLQDRKIDFEELEYVDFIENISILLGEDKENAISDIHLIVGTCPKIRKGGLIEDFLLYFEEEDGKKGILKYNPVSPEQVKNFVNHLIENAIENGANEVDTVINVGALKEKNYELVKEDIKAVVEAANKKLGERLEHEIIRQMTTMGNAIRR